MEETVEMEGRRSPTSEDKIRYHNVLGVHQLHYPPLIYRNKTKEPKSLCILHIT